MTILKGQIVLFLGGPPLNPFTFFKNRRANQRFAQVINCPEDIAHFIHLWKIRQEPDIQDEAVQLHIKQLGGQAVWVRPGTSDIRVLWDCYYKQYQLPPMHIRDNATILDLGANVGYTAASLGVRYPQAKIIGVELDCQNAELARINTEFLGKRCTILNAGIWHEETLISYGGNTEHALRIDEENTQEQTYHVQTMTMQSLLEQFDLAEVDYVKMDIEGAEHSVLDPTRDLNWLHQIKNMNVEVHQPATIEGITHVLSQHGFDNLTQPTHWSAVIASRQSEANSIPLRHAA